MTCTELVPKCVQLLDMHTLSGCDTVSYPFNNGKLSALNVLKSGDFPGPFQVLGDIDATYADLMDTDQRLFAAMYGQSPGTSMSQGRYRMYSKKTG